MFDIWGDYNTDGECLLHQADSLRAAKWWVDSYVRWGDFGGYESITVHRKFDPACDNGEVLYTAELVHD